MAAGQRVATPNAGAARISGALFAIAGSIAVVAGVASILLGNPDAAHDLAPLAGPGDLLSRFLPISPLLTAGIAGLVAGVVGYLLAVGRLDSRAAAIELLVLGAVIDGCIGGLASRIGHTVDGAVMTATVAALMGGSALIAGGVIAMLGHRASTDR